MADIQGFLSEHPDWRERLDTTQLWLGIPLGVLERLGDLKKDAPKWLAKDGAWNAEKDFSELIDEPNDGGGIGMRLGTVVDYPLFAKSPSYSALLTDELFEKMGWSQHIESAQSACDQLDEAQKTTLMIRQRLLGYAGWLTTNPIYVREANLLDEAWKALSGSVPFPSDITVFRGTPSTFKKTMKAKKVPQRRGRSKTEPVFEFLTRMTRFCKRWGIIQLPDWNLPVPQGPLFGEKEILSFVRNNDLTGLVLYVPSWYEVIASRDNVLDTLKNKQRRVGGDRFIEGDGWPISHHARYAAMFMCRHALQSIEQRSGKLDEKSDDFELVLKLVSEWLDEVLPEPRGGAKKGKGEGKEEDLDEASRARRLLLLANQRLGGTMPRELFPQKTK